MKLAISKGYKNILLSIKSKTKKQPVLIMCACCNVNPVDVLDGYFTCPDCIGKL